MGSAWSFRTILALVALLFTLTNALSIHERSNNQQEHEGRVHNVAPQNIHHRLNWHLNLEEQRRDAEGQTTLLMASPSIPDALENTCQDLLIFSSDL